MHAVCRYNLVVVQSSLRILDANFNRAREGLRVIEEFARFVWDDAVLCGEAKRLRHGLLDAIGGEAVRANVLSRDTGGDVGTEVSTEAEGERADAGHVVTAAFKRVSEALRVIEEYSKVGGKAARRFERLRYDLYILEAAFVRRMRPKALLDDLRLYVIVTGSLCSRSVGETVDAVLAGGADCVQLREKDADGGELLATAKLAAGRCHNAGRLFIMNDRSDIARLAGADGVHVGQEDLSVGEARRIVGPAGIVGVSCQTIEHARAAVLAGADYIGVGPVFASRTKQRAEIPGLPLIEQVAVEIRIPAVAIAGIDRDTIDAVIEAGARRVAICSAIIGAGDIEGEARWFAEKLKSL